MGKMKYGFIGIPVILTVLAGCAIQHSNEAEEAQRSMVGLARERVLICMGAPDSRAAAGDTEVWTYHTGDGQTTTEGYGNRLGFFGGTSVTESCKVDVVMSAGQVSRVQYSGLTGRLLSPHAQCWYAIGNCLGEAPQPVRYAPPVPVAERAPVRKSSCTHEQEVQARIARQNGYTGGPKCD